MTNNGNNLVQAQEPKIPTSVLPVVSSIALVPDAKPEETSVDLAYPFAVASYEEAQKRLDVIEKRLQELIAFAVTITVAVITISSGKHVDFTSKFFKMAMFACAIGMLCGITARIAGSLQLIGVSVLWAKWLEKPTRKFKTDFIYFAGEHNDKNALLILRKSQATGFAVCCFFIETICLVGWVVYPNSSETGQNLHHPTVSQSLGVKPVVHSVLPH